MGQAGAYPSPATSGRDKLVPPGTNQWTRPAFAKATARQAELVPPSSILFGYWTLEIPWNLEVGIGKPGRSFTRVTGCFPTKSGRASSSFDFQ